MTTDILRAECAELYIANNRFDAIRLLDSKEYRMSQTQALEPIGRHRNYLSQLNSTSPKKSETLARYGFSWVTVAARYSDGTQNRTARTLSLQDVAILWMVEAIEFKNPLAGAITLVLAKDSLEDRFDQVYGSRRSTEQRRADDCRILDIPATWELMFDNAFEDRLAKVSGFHKNDIRNGKLYWEFIYYFLTSDERSKLDEVNPVDPETGRRSLKIHQCLTDETKARLKPHIDTVYVLMGSAKSIRELRRLLQRQHGFDQGNLFDGWDINVA